MEIMISRWIKETITEYDRAKVNLNIFRMEEMKRLVQALRQMRDKLL